MEAIPKSGAQVKERKQIQMFISNDETFAHYQSQVRVPGAGPSWLGSPGGVVVQ